MTTSFRPSLKDQLNAAGFRATPSRLAIAKYMQQAHKPLTTAMLANTFVPHELDLATLYRTLKSFEEKGLVRHVTIDQRFASYEWVEEDGEHHHHLICQTCGLIEEIPDCELESLEKRVLKQATRFREIHSHSLEFFGVCKACKK
ncbi:transcriptional repressor [Patescibacteria group bacterium]|nr:transcriptional repressor [Patescibacteria group bacterium]